MLRRSFFLYSTLNFALKLSCLAIPFHSLSGFAAPSAISDTHPDLFKAHSSLINAVASLNFHTKGLTKGIEPDDSLKKGMQFSAQEVDHLWEKVIANIGLTMSNESQERMLLLYENAYRDYNEGRHFLYAGQLENGKMRLLQAQEFLDNLWEEALASETLLLEHELPLHACNEKEPPFQIPEEIDLAMRPYYLPASHEMYPELESIFSKTRVTLDESLFTKAGFQILDKRPRSFILVAKHKKLPGYLLKAYLDNEKRKKQGKESWKWLTLRCKGAAKVRNIIRQNNIQHFVVADKWIYPLPANPSPPNSPIYTRHLAALLVTDMELVNEKRNLHAWYHYVTKKHLDELYVIMSRAKGSSYRPDNISYNIHGKFAFIDTEYPSRGPDYESIREFLKPAMCKYWDRLVKSGG